jgi:hypothetical protein
MPALLAVIASLAVLLGFITAVLGLLNARATRRAVKEAAATTAKVQEISVNVDGRLSTLIERQAQLLDALHSSGTPIPPIPPPASPGSGNVH